MKLNWYHFALGALLILMSGAAIFVGGWACGRRHFGKVAVPKWTVFVSTFALDSRAVKVSRITPRHEDAEFVLSLTGEAGRCWIVQTGINVGAAVPERPGNASGAGYSVLFSICVFPDRIEPDWPMPGGRVSRDESSPPLPYYYDGDDLIVVCCWGKGTRFPYYYSVRYHLENKKDAPSRPAKRAGP